MKKKTVTAVGKRMARKKMVVRSPPAEPLALSQKAELPPYPGPNPGSAAIRLVADTLGGGRRLTIAPERAGAAVLVVRMGRGAVTENDDALERMSRAASRRSISD